MTDVYHSGELTVQKMAGAEVAAEQNGRGIKKSIPKGAIAFLETQSLIITASVDKNGRVWSSVLTGEPGFLHVEDEETLRIRSNPVLNDPLIHNLNSNQEIGLLVIDFSRRIRLRMNGTGRFDEDQQLVVQTEQVYGNCPKYIQKRSLLPNGVFHRKQQFEHHFVNLPPKQQEWIRQSDTFFIGSMSSEGKLDASHRGGSPGFVKVFNERTLIFPDYFGNSMFNTLGNIYSNPSTGILFMDFDFGHSLQLTGRSEIIWDEKEISQFPAAERLVRLEIDEALYTENSTQLSWIQTQ
ncbi:pyridoxamine 5'-phosphate oxidase family protein [Paenibacillus sedimenti]|uniref:Pyridoxamine 5'-phosphate oxidase family protein n=1 Tax=Paenibacillus sedimenti TaxID=2770274 RepID=A0A926QHQ9_9BACL|nr:pyridoxamine 5'-phosphate oxidase family protein [Paenibacillus sedimenti]MBD0379811.1 pyridoxamine 5'-phosphate oxidase family protein [Paenibacillus sedimenti]